MEVFLGVLCVILLYVAYETLKLKRKQKENERRRKQKGWTANEKVIEKLIEQVAKLQVSSNIQSFLNEVNSKVTRKTFLIRPSGRSTDFISLHSAMAACITVHTLYETP